MKRYRYTHVSDIDVLRLIDKVQEIINNNDDRSIQSKLFKIVAKTHDDGFVAIIQEVRE